MDELSATATKMQMDSHMLAARQDAEHIMDLLSDFIPEAAKNHARYKLGRAFYDSGIRLCKKAER